MSMARAASRGLLRSALICILAAALLIGAVAGLTMSRLGLSDSYLVKSATVYTAGAALVLIGLPRHHPFRSFGPANQVTVVRGALVALLAGLIGEAAGTVLAALVTTVATGIAVLDGVDGWLARRTRLASAFGARFDMETDALLILILSVLAWQFGKAGLWVLGSGLLRYAFIAAGWALPALRHPLPPSRRRKAVAVAQMVALIVAVAPFVPAVVSAPLAAIALVTLTVSFLVDVVWLFSPHEANVT
ncbi:MAG TPA: CDP-alcohol phosphatidyltransferase family protein [Steroidobacteraceae bacterium]|jgi:phosphatidylglycerophosphate synthase|nr:CDP-alcohol phosphatidyltransferase family protein [Steroidobacteraceae bacterium]